MFSAYTSRWIGTILEYMRRVSRAINNAFDVFYETAVLTGRLRIWFFFFFIFAFNLLAAT